MSISYENKMLQTIHLFIDKKICSALLRAKRKMKWRNNLEFLVFLGSFVLNTKNRFGTFTVCAIIAFMGQNSFGPYF